MLCYVKDASFVSNEILRLECAICFKCILCLRCMFVSNEILHFEDEPVFFVSKQT